MPEHRAPEITSLRLGARARAALRPRARRYVTIQADGSEDDLAYMKLYDYGQKVVTNRLRGFLLMQVGSPPPPPPPPPRSTSHEKCFSPSPRARDAPRENRAPFFSPACPVSARDQIVKYLSHVHPKPRTIYLSRHGQSTYNKDKKIGGNPDLTEFGEQYARWLAEFVQKVLWKTPQRARGVGYRASLDTAPSSDADPDGAAAAAEDEPVSAARLWTSTLRRTIQTARHIPHPVILREDGSQWQQMAPRVYRNLDEIFAGDFEGMTYKEIEDKFGDEAFMRKKDKLGYRYPRGARAGGRPCASCFASPRL